ncbi:hypothetical protein CALVIDRAFT_155196 [Calocera viscosa TUFC12733]|uniref:Uncharacterized protein n=1 Tax=Calocera viscosa (strain TUFC12733) TaxID=1330018 RepID=A0A167LNX1_CALVF|nr:hypothetical protein CALVIDRAFT_155196 [Calocera viscosa TUFC12733]
MARAKQPFSAKTKKAPMKVGGRSVKNAMLGSTKPSRSPVLEVPTMRTRPSPTDREHQRMRSAVKPRHLKTKTALPSKAALQPGWRQRTERQKEQLRLLQEMDQDLSDEEGTPDDAESEVGSDDEDVWATDLTLIGGNLEEEEEAEESRHEALIDSLKKPFAALSVQMRSEMVQVLEPTTQKIKSTNQETMMKDEQIKAELAALHAYAENLQSDAEERATGLKDVMTDSQAMLKRLLKELEAQYSAREQLRVELPQRLEDLYGDMVVSLEEQTESYDNEARKFVLKAKKIYEKSKVSTTAWKQMIAI